MAKKVEKEDTATVEAVKNIPLALCVESREDLPEPFRRHPGGARVERGTKITVTKDKAAQLKQLGYVK